MTDRTPTPAPTRNETQGASRAPIWLFVAMGLAFVGLLLAVTALIALRAGPGGSASDADPATDPLPPATQPSEALGELEVTDFTLTNQDGRTIDESIFDGRYTVLDFVFTNCPFACPGMTAQMALVQEKTDAPLVSITVDPDNDTPQRLRAFAENYAADLDRWTFLTGDEGTIRGVLDGLGLGIRDDPSQTIELDGGGSMANIAHPTRLILIGPDRSVRGMFSYTSQREIDLLIERLNSPPIGSAAGP